MAKLDQLVTAARVRKVRFVLHSWVSTYICLKCRRSFSVTEEYLYQRLEQGSDCGHCSGQLVRAGSTVHRPQQ